MKKYGVLEAKKMARIKRSKENLAIGNCFCLFFCF